MAVSFPMIHDIGAWLGGEIASAGGLCTGGVAAHAVGVWGDGTLLNGIAVDRLAVGRGLYKTASLVISYQTVLAAAASLSFAVDAQDDTAIGFGATPAVIPAHRGRFSAFAVAQPTEYTLGALQALTLTAGALPVTVVALAPGGGARTVRGVVILDYDVQGARQFLRSRITATLSAAAVDTAELSATWVFSGAYENVPT